jgi:hypothetical protein
MQHQIMNKLAAGPLRWLVENTISYWQQVPYRFCRYNGGYQLQPASKVGRLVIIARQHYQEFIHHYPITQLSELKQILQTEYPQAGVLHFIGPVQDQRRPVCTVVISPDTLSQFSRVTLLLPESLLLWQAVQPENTLHHIKDQSEYFLYSGAATPVSQRINQFCPNGESFALNNGISDLAQQRTLNASAYTNLLVNALAKAVPALHRLSIVVRPPVVMLQLPFKAMVITAGSLLLAYAVLVSSYYQFSLSARQDKLQQLGDTVNQLLDTQQQLQQTDAAAQALAELQQDKRASAQLWLVLVPLLQQDNSLHLQNIATENGRLILRGQANQATAVLTALQNTRWVNDARFDASVTRQRDKDMFVISLMLSQQPLLTEPTAEAQHAAE